MKDDSFLRFLGLAARAGKLVYGAQAVDRAIKTRKAKLVVLDGSASEATKKAFCDACAYYRTKVIVLEEQDVLGRSLNKENNKIIGIVCPHFAKHAWEKYHATSGGEIIEQN